MAQNAHFRNSDATKRRLLLTTPRTALPRGRKSRGSVVFGGGKGYSASGSAAGASAGVGGAGSGAGGGDAASAGYDQ